MKVVGDHLDEPLAAVDAVPDRILSLDREILGNKPDAKYIGGFNLFGKEFGDYAQDIILNVEYD